ncbi:MAG: transcriptional repressor [Firmicutes bacterium]|nr:transcriptional repressor [Bacillota bacterium]
MKQQTYKTNNRTKMMEYLKSNQNRTVSVKDIDAHMRSLDCPVNMTTIYRYLDKLEREGVVMRYADEHGEKATYQLTEREHHCDSHLHLKCVDCGSVIHLDCHFMDEIAGHIANDHGFRLQCRNSVIYGLCQKCQKGEQKI